ncbi:hypothetical protein [Cryobacterium aureum]|uniref:hypothetical protein n=1 Tax=Cryobacterium aureum TaxID=995037 RepID=UPI00196ABCCE|nr:hypothetical protein [Cryobacterium aureum]
MATIELLHIADCPNSAQTLLRLQRAIKNTIPSNSPIKSTLIDSAETAASLPFAGSPTILVDAVDLFPTDGRTNDLACRIYLTPNGLAGSPTQQQIEEALAGGAAPGSRPSRRGFKRVEGICRAHSLRTVHRLHHGRSRPRPCRIRSPQWMRMNHGIFRKP